MKTITSILMLFIGLFASAQTPCVGGTAGPYDCSNYDLQSAISLSGMSASSGNDSWGWTDPTTGKEYALMGLNNGTAFIDVSNPTSPVYLGKLPTHTSNSSWRDVKTYNNHAFIVSEAGNHGMQVFDLTRLRNVNNPPVTFNNDAHYSGFGRAHNIVINEDTGYAYGVGTTTFNGGPHFVNIQNPLNPVAAGGYSLDDYSHDAQVVTYCGPDKDYSGIEILIGSNETEISIVDISDKANPTRISTISYSNVGYTHQGWFTEDQQYFVLGDETDETGSGFNSRTIIFDFEDLDNPQEHFEYFGPTPASDHNGYVKGTKYYMANYRAGFRAIDVSDIANQNMTEEGYFDTFPNNNNAGANAGAWNVYPFFESGNIIISDMNRGFFLIKASSGDTTSPVANCQDFTVSLDANGDATIAAQDINDGSTDNSGTVYFILCDDTFDCSDLGANTVELEVYDDYGNRDSCNATITVVDDLSPTLSCPGDFGTGLDQGQTFYTLPDYVANGNATGADNCTASLTITQTPAAGTQLPEGVHTITFNTADDSGNPANCSFDLTVEEGLSIGENNFENGLVLYPNPAANIISIISKDVAISSIVISDVSGKIVYNNINMNTLDITINVAVFSKGMYFVTLNNIITKKIIKK